MTVSVRCPPAAGPLARDGSSGFPLPNEAGQLVAAGTLLGTYVIGRDGIIRLACCSTDFTRQRVEPGDIVALLRQLSLKPAAISGIVAWT